MKVAVRGGHCPKVPGARGILDELIEDRKVKDALIKYSKQLGNEVLDVTPPDSTSSSDLSYGVNKANNWGADLFVSIHFNKAYDSYNGFGIRELGWRVWCRNSRAAYRPGSDRYRPRGHSEKHHG